jgi:hypothetical protein
LDVCVADPVLQLREGVVVEDRGQARQPAMVRPGAISPRSS